MRGSMFIRTAAFVLLMFGSMGSSKVYKCTGADGSITYQQATCSGGQAQSQPSLLKPPTLTEEERFNAQAYSLGLTPDEARRALSGESASAEPPAARHPVQPQIDHHAQRRRERDCNKRHDALATEARATFSGRALGNLMVHLQRIEVARTNCLQGVASAPVVERRRAAQPVTPKAQPPTLGNQIGVCLGHCASEQGICFSHCAGNGVCASNCASSHGRCVGACSR